MDEGKDWKSGIFEMRSQPSRALDWTSPAQIFHGGRMPRSPILPHLPVDIDTYRIHAHRSWLAERDTANARTNRMRIQGHEKPKLWDRMGEIKARREQGNSYFVKPEDGDSVLLRNRCHLKSVEPEGYRLVNEMPTEVLDTNPSDTPPDTPPFHTPRCHPRHAPTPG